MVAELIPLLATEVVDRRLLSRAPRFGDRLRRHKGGLFRGHYVCACPDWENERGEHLLSVVDHTAIQPILARLLDNEQFLSQFGVRSVSKVHERHKDLGVLPGVGTAMIEYVPGRVHFCAVWRVLHWRGPVWLPVNYMLVQSIEKLGKFDQYKRDIPYATLVQAFQSLVRPLLSKSDAELASWREATSGGARANGQLIADLVPELTLVIGDQPPVAELEPQQARRRFQLVFPVIFPAPLARDAYRIQRRFIRPVAVGVSDRNMGSRSGSIPDEPLAPVPTHQDVRCVSCVWL